MSPRLIPVANTVLSFASGVWTPVGSMSTIYLHDNGWLEIVFEDGHTEMFAPGAVTKMSFREVGEG